MTLILPCKLTVLKLILWHADTLTLTTLAVIAWTKNRSRRIQLPTEGEQEPLESPTRPRIARSPSVGPSAPHSPKFDLMLARVSLGIEVVVYALLVFSTNGLMFAACTALGALGMGFSPAVQSIALTLYNRRGGKDTGKLFGAMSVVNALRCVLSRLSVCAAVTDVHGSRAARRCLGRSSTD